MIFNISKRNYRVFWLILSILILSFSIIGTKKLYLETDAFKLMPQNHKTFDAFKESVKIFGGIDNIILFVKFPEKEELELYLSFIDELCIKIEEIEEGIEVTSHTPDPKPYLVFYLENLPILCTEEEWKRILNIIIPENMEEILKETKMEISSIIDPELKEFLLIDPLKFHRIFLDKYQKPLGSYKIDYLSGYFLSQDHSSLLIFIKPRGTAQDISYSSKVVENIENLIKKEISFWKYDIKPPEIKIGGGFRIAVEDSRVIKKDIKIQVISSLILVLFLYYLSFRNFKAFFLPIIPLSMGIISTFGFAGWFLKELNAPSSAFSTLLVGLGIDFVILLYSRYLEEKSSGLNYEEILYNLEKDVYPSIFLGAITTVGTFGALYFTKLKGLRELGILTSIGILFVMFFSFTLLPLLFALEEKFESRKKSLYRFFLFGVDKIINFSNKKKSLIIFISLFFIGLSLVFINEIFYQDTVESLRSKDNEGIKIQREISNVFGVVGYPSIVLIKAKGLEELISYDENLSSFLDSLKEKNIVFSHQGLSDYLPSVEKSKENLKRVREINYEYFYKNFKEICISLKLNIESFSNFLSYFEKSFRKNKSLESETLGRYEELIKFNKIFSKGDDYFYSLRYIYFPEGKYKREPPIALENYVNKNKNMVLSGINAMAKDLRILVKKDALFGTLIGFVIVFIMLYFYFKKLREVFLVLIPLISGLILLLGFMGFFKVPFNSFNIFVLLMIIGIGVDYGIHILHRFKISGGDMEKLSATGSAIFFSALTTIAGFGSLSLSHFLGLKSMGYIAIMGTVFVMIFTLTLLPAILKK